MSDRDLNRELERAREAGDLERVVPIAAAGDGAFRFSYLISHQAQDGPSPRTDLPSPSRAQ
ncbi:MAG TPA: hypothetical protein VFM85_00710 [Actinomycetota bacterium]|nr:hypothetical protein [Actinomycetota bacterium]